MKVFISPSVARGGDGLATGIARALAGPGGSVMLLREAGVRNLSRRLSAAEVVLLREALRDLMGSPDDRGIVGYVCGGRVLDGRGGATMNPGQGPVLAVAVEDHVNLTWRSPLIGRNDDSAGPRFPSMTGIYASELVTSRLSAVEGMIVRTGVVAGVLDQRGLNAFESEMVETHRYAAVSSELVPVVIVAAHMGLRVAAAVVGTTEGVA
jgi:Phosphorylase superfamily